MTTNHYCGFCGTDVNGIDSTRVRGTNICNPCRSSLGCYDCGKPIQPETAVWLMLNGKDLWLSCKEEEHTN